MGESSNLSEQELAATAGSHGEVSDQSSRLPMEIEPGNQLIAMAMDKNMSVDIIEKLLDQKMRFEADEARKAFAVAMAKCQKEMPAIQAQAENDQTSSMYAKLEHINAGITPIYTKHGFSISFGEGKAEIAEMIRIEARVIHKLGHVDQYFYDLPLDLAGIRDQVNKTKIHAKGSTTTYGRRYLLTMIFNLTVGDDVDGNVVGGADFITEDEAIKLEAFVTENELPSKNLFREFRVDSWGQIKSKDLDKTWARIKQIQGKR